MKIIAVVFTAVLFVISVAVPATTWGWNWNVYNQTQNELQAGGQEVAGKWISTITVPARGSAPVNMTGGYCPGYLYIYTPYCRIQSVNKFQYWIKCLDGSGSGTEPYLDSTACCWNIDVTVEEIGGKDANGFPYCRVRKGKP